MIQHPGDLNAETWHLAADIDVYAWYFTPRFCSALPSARKFRLFMAACFREVWAFIPFPEFRGAIEAGERFADDGNINAAIAASEAAEERTSSELSPWRELGWALTVLPMADPLAGEYVKEWTVGVKQLESTELNAAFGRTWEQAAALHLQLLRDIVGNPFRPVAFSPDWRTDTAVSLARQMYESRVFSAMPILADALQDAGCDNEAILAHCRDAGQVHVRGCWVVDLVLDRR